MNGCGQPRARHRIRAHLLERRLRVSREGVIGATEHDALARAEGPDVEVVRRLEPIDVDDGQLGLSVAQPREQVRVGLDDETNADARVREAEAPQRLRQEELRRVRPDPRDELSGLTSEEVVEVRFAAARGTEELAGAFEHELAGRCRYDTGPLAVDQSAADRFLQRLETATECGLRQAEGGSGGAKAPVSLQGAELFEMPQTDHVDAFTA